MNIVSIRQEKLTQWLAQILGFNFELKIITPGAGVRRYYRVVMNDQTWVVMDAPEDKKFNHFIKIARAFNMLTVRTPEILAVENEQQFLLLSDFGSQSLFDGLAINNVDILYSRTMDNLLKIQTYRAENLFSLPEFDMQLYQMKMNWFLEFYLKQYLKINIAVNLQNKFQSLFDILIVSALNQPQTCVHYDFHSKNLMLLPNHEVGVLDFQDAVWGPITYDLMALLRDCYIDWPSERVSAWLKQYHQKVLRAGTACTEDPQIWQKWCDFSSVQRHIKCIGLFARFHITGYSSDYLIYIPRIIRYLKEIAPQYAELTLLHKLLESIPA